MLGKTERKKKKEKKTEIVSCEPFWTVGEKAEGEESLGGG